MLVPRRLGGLVREEPCVKMIAGTFKETGRRLFLITKATRKHVADSRSL